MEEGVKGDRRGIPTRRAPGRGDKVRGGYWYSPRGISKNFPGHHYWSNFMMKLSHVEIWSAGRDV